ncbi:Phage integrase [Mesorhizobium metallidurans STM 2683]|uniref:Phage integrase n=1 Tax=Mesorhizobium metallidurans STM 2683 TaxID=1297569 RepID=M5EVU3_9HYPH|nr:tyrosine-type recombinase/integrase [Mesorhizobium metallidurans]CCV09134.1 Phage integrase [Mesorhizobium metallidurans STM 2683]
MASHPNSRSGGGPRAATLDDRALVQGYLAQHPKLAAGALSAARHFLKWAGAHDIAYKDLDAAAVDRFARHRCRCGRYSPRQLRDPVYMTDVRRFLRHLENAGIVTVPASVDRLDKYLPEFSVRLRAVGYSKPTYAGRLSQARHFAEWILQARIPAKEITDVAIEQFALHDCRCGIRTKRGRRVTDTGTKDRRRGARRFVNFLRDQDVINLSAPPDTLEIDPRLDGLAQWLRRERGATEETIRRYQHEAGRWIGVLGKDPAHYNAATIRSIVLDQIPERSRSSIRMTVTVLRAFLRFTVSQGLCAPFLLHAVPPAIRRKLSTVPRVIPTATIEDIIASSGTTTSVDIRDRAILLLLARMALRAGDVWQLRLFDIDWRAGRLRLLGKSRRGTMLPLPQDAGDALLAYIEDARPIVSTDRVFLRTQAPFTPLRSSAEIAGIVARILNRGGFSHLPTGSHVFRHSLASAWLRDGADLDQIGIALRHASRDTTAIYAKVDISMLAAVVQSWPGAAS